MIEVGYYPIKLTSQALSEQTSIEIPSTSPSFQGQTFWNNATKYTLLSHDEQFVEEVAYMMVTLHRTGA